MNSQYENLLPTPAQKLVDERFLEEIEESFVAPLATGLKMLVRGYEFMKRDDRWFHVLKLNEPLFGQGDFLDFNGMLVYSGKRLGNVCEMTWADMTVKQYRPRFLDLGSHLHRNEIGGGEQISDIEHFFRYERELYDDLHLSFKAALLFNYVKSKVIASPKDVLSFVLGCYLETGEKLNTSRCAVQPVFGNDNLYRGWNILIRDAKPSARLMKELGEFIRNDACEAPTLVDVAESDLFSGIENGSKQASPFSRMDYSSITFEDPSLSKKPRKQRQPDPKTELACRYIYELEQQGVVIDGRKGGIGFAKIAADLVEKYGDKVRSYEPNTLSRVYRAWKERNGLAKGDD